MRDYDPDGPGAQQPQRTIFAGYDAINPTLAFKGTGTADLTANDLAHRFLWGPVVDQLMADEQIDDLVTPGDVLWALPDHLGTIRDIAIADAVTGEFSIANHRVYDSFGRRTSQTNAAVDTIFGYTGKPHDEATGLTNHWNRWYDPELGKWTSEDPIGFAGGDVNLGRYVGNAPLRYRDAFGLMASGEQDDATNDVVRQLQDKLRGGTMGTQLVLLTVQ